MKTLDYRVAVGLDYPALTGAFTDTFDAPLNPANWVYTVDTETGDPPLVEDGKAQIRLHGAGNREFFATRPHLFPRSLTTKFTISFTVHFPTIDPVVDAIITVGTIDALLGADQDPLRIIHQGSARVISGEREGFEIGKIAEHMVGTFPTSHLNDHSPHTYTIIYDPAGATVLTINRDGTTLYADAGAGTQPRPYYVQFGMVMKDEEWTAGQTHTLQNGGLADDPNPLTIIEVWDFSVTPDPAETRTYPTWTSANAGGTTFDNAAAGERVSIDGETWAIIPKSQIASIRTTVGRSLGQAHDSFDVELLAPLPSAPETTPNRFRDDLYSHRPIIIDSRIGDDVTATWTDWRRHICGIIEPKGTGDIRVSLSGRDRPSTKLDTFAERAFVNLEIDAATQEGSLDGARFGLTLDRIFQDLADTGDAIYGDKLGATETLFRLIDQAPKMLSTGGSPLGSVMGELCDRAVQEMWREYDVQDEARYGRLRTNLWTLDATAEYEFRGHGATNPNILAPGVRLLNDNRKGPGRVYYRNDSPEGAFQGLNTGLVPVNGAFPTFPYPPQDRELNDSYGPFADLAVSTLVSLRDRDDNTVNGGVAMHRYKMENSQRRSIEFSVVGHNWMRPGQVITISDTNGTGITNTEKWVIDNIETVIAQGTLKARLHCSSADWLKAIRETL